MRRSPNCACALVFFLPGAIPLLVLYSLFRSAYRAAHIVFHRTRAGLRDHPVTRVKRLRNWTAGLCSLAFLVVYGAEQDFQEAVAEGALRLLVAPWLLVLTAPAAIFLLFRPAPPARRSRMRAELRGPLLSLVKYVCALTSVPAMFLLTSLPAYLGASQNVQIITALAFIPLILWALFFTAASSHVVIRTEFGTGGVHPALPALLAGLLVWELVPVSMTVSGLPPGPAPFPLLLLFGGPVTVTAVVWWEIHRLRTRHGVTFRS